MREIKFRGLRTDGKGWVYGGYFQHTPDEEGVRYYIFDFNEGAVEVLPETVGQFTGLKDKNGAEIYEGDKVKSYLRGKEVFGEVFYPTDVCGFLFGSKDDFIELGICYSLSDKIEVIGYIHTTHDKGKEETR